MSQYQALRAVRPCADVPRRQFLERAFAVLGLFFRSRVFALGNCEHDAVRQLASVGEINRSGIAYMIPARAAVVRVDALPRPVSGWSHLKRETALEGVPDEERALARRGLLDVKFCQIALVRRCCWRPVATICFRHRVKPVLTRKTATLVFGTNTKLKTNAQLRRTGFNFGEAESK